MTLTHDFPTPKPELFQFGPEGGVPNNPVLPVVLIRGAVPPVMSASMICDLYEANGWTGTWTWSVFTYHHYHPNAHEALTAASGWSDIILGGPNGTVVRLNTGDTVVLPAGTGHCRLNASSDFSVCGAYPVGQSSYETLQEGADPIDVAQRIARVPVPKTDPIFGADGPLVTVWAN